MSNRSVRRSKKEWVAGERETAATNQYAKLTSPHTNTKYKLRNRKNSQQRKGRKERRAGDTEGRTGGKGGLGFLAIRQAAGSCNACRFVDVLPPPLRHSFLPLSLPVHYALFYRLILMFISAIILFYFASAIKMWHTKHSPSPLLLPLPA